MNKHAPTWLRLAMAANLCLLMAALARWPTAAAAMDTQPLPGPDEPSDERLDPPPPPVDSWDPQQTLERRNPFLPTGYQPRTRSPDATAPHAAEPERPHGPTPEQWAAARASLRIGGISRRGDDIAALVNGRVVTIGDTIEVMHDGRAFQWAIESIGLRTGLELRALTDQEAGEEP